MNQLFYNSIVNSTAHRPIRDMLAMEVINDPARLADLIEIALSTNDRHHHKACWTLELVLEAHIEWLAPYLESFCSTLSSFKQDGAVRSISKICLFAIQHHQKGHAFLTHEQLQQITEACFDWLIHTQVKVASKANAMRALYPLGKKEDWIYPELVRILSEDAAKHTAAYKIAAKDILRKISK